MTSPPTIEPRLLTQKQAAAYCGVSAPTFAKWVLNGAMPPALSGMKRWDRKAIDAHLDKVSGLDVRQEQEDPFLAWEREYDAANAQAEDDYDRRKRERDARKIARGGRAY